MRRMCYFCCRVLCAFLHPEDIAGLHHERPDERATLAAGDRARLHRLCQLLRSSCKAAEDRCRRFRRQVVEGSAMYTVHIRAWCIETRSGKFAPATTEPYALREGTILLRHPFRIRRKN